MFHRPVLSTDNILLHLTVEETEEYRVWLFTKCNPKVYFGLIHAQDILAVTCCLPHGFEQTVDEQKCSFCRGAFYLQLL